KATSTTAPITWLTRPVRLLTGLAAFGVSLAATLRARGLGFVSAAVAIFFLLPCLAFERFGARNDFDELGGDRGLARPVILDRQAVDHVAGVAGRIVHRGH